MSRVVIPRQDLYDLLQDRFRDVLENTGCRTCKTPFPFFCDTDDGANWRVAMPPSCENHCRSALNIIVQEMSATYELSPPLWRNYHRTLVASGD